jgi:hypothetical protein
MNLWLADALARAAVVRQLPDEFRKRSGAELPTLRVPALVVESVPARREGSP